MWSYYVFMVLLVVTLILWAIIALRDDTREPSKPEKEKPAPQSKRPGD